MKRDFLKSSRRGSVLVFSLLILSILLVTSLTILSTALLDRKASLSTGSSTRSFQVADSGVEEVLYQIYKVSPGSLDTLAGNLGTSCSSGTIAFNAAGGTAKVVFYQDETTVFTDCTATDWRDRVVKIKSEGTAGSSSRAVEVAVACASFLDAEEAKEGAVGLPANAQAIAIDGDYAYIGGADVATEKGLHVFDISDPTDLQHIGFLPTQSGAAALSGWGDDALGVTVSGDYAYIATDYGGLVIADISTPSSPSYSGKIDLPGETWAVEIENNRAYTATQTGIRIIDVSDKTNPTISGSYGFSSTPAGTLSNDIALYDSDSDGTSEYAYVAMRSGGVGIVDITNPSSPAGVTRISGDGFSASVFAYDVAIYEGPGTDYLYVARHPTSALVAAQGAILTYSLADPENPVLIDTDSMIPPADGSPRTVAVFGSDLYVGAGQSGIYLYNLADASAPSFKERIIQTPGSFWEVVPAGGKIFSAGGSTGLNSFDICGS